MGTSPSTVPINASPEAPAAPSSEASRALLFFHYASTSGPPHTSRYSDPSPYVGVWPRRQVPCTLRIVAEITPAGTAGTRITVGPGQTGVDRSSGDLVCLHVDRRYRREYAGGYVSDGASERRG